MRIVNPQRSACPFVTARVQVHKTTGTQLPATQLEPREGAISVLNAAKSRAANPQEEGNKLL